MVQPRIACSTVYRTMMIEKVQPPKENANSQQRNITSTCMTITNLLASPWDPVGSLGIPGHPVGSPGGTSASPGVLLLWTPTNIIRIALQCCPICILPFIFPADALAQLLTSSVRHLSFLLTLERTESQELDILEITECKYIVFPKCSFPCLEAPL